MYNYIERKMTLNDINKQVSEGNLIVSEGKAYTKEEWKAIKYAEDQEAHFDLLQLTKKIQL